MMNPNLKTALRRMGYRHMGKGVWAKPVAYHILTVHTKNDKVIFTNHLVGIKDQPLTYSQNELDGPDYEDSIKFAEYNTNVKIGRASDFGFVSREQLLQDPDTH